MNMEVGGGGVRVGRLTEQLATLLINEAVEENFGCEAACGSRWVFWFPGSRLGYRFTASEGRRLRRHGRMICECLDPTSGEMFSRNAERGESYLRRETRNILR
jgi:hypothetical protein